jgi:hypothetical protein
MPDLRVYTTADVLAKLQLTARTFSRLKKDQALPFLEEVKPRLGRYPRYRADLVDRYLAGQWEVPRRFFAQGRRR